MPPPPLYGGRVGGAYKVKKLAARDSHFLLNNFLIKNFGGPGGVFGGPGGGLGGPGFFFLAQVPAVALPLLLPVLKPPPGPPKPPPGPPKTPPGPIYDFNRK